jgi:hypothetical protein
VYAHLLEGGGIHGRANHYIKVDEAMRTLLRC